MDLHCSISGDESLLGSIGPNPTLAHDQKNILPVLPFRQQVPRVCDKKFRELRSWLSVIYPVVSKSTPADLRYLPTVATILCQPAM